MINVGIMAVYHRGEGPNLRHTNEVIGAYVTAGARIHLYGYLDRLQMRMLYCDTDSVIYIQPIAEIPLVKTGDCPGAITSELKPGFHIEEFVSGGPKNYAYRIVNPVTGTREKVCKVRGITLNYKSSQTVNFDVIKAVELRGDIQRRSVFILSTKLSTRGRTVGYIY